MAKGSLRWRAWLTYGCGHQAPSDYDTEAGVNAALGAAAALGPQGICPACAAPEHHWQWRLWLDSPRADLPLLLAPRELEGLDPAVRQELESEMRRLAKAAESMRRSRLKKIDQHLKEWRNLLEAPWRPVRLEGHREQFRAALLGARLVEQITDADWWLERKRLDVCQLLAEAIAFAVVRPANRASHAAVLELLETLAEVALSLHRHRPRTARRSRPTERGAGRPGDGGARTGDHPHLSDARAACRAIRLTGT